MLPASQPRFYWPVFMLFWSWGRWQGEGRLLMLSAVVIDGPATCVTLCVTSIRCQRASGGCLKRPLMSSTKIVQPLSDVVAQFVSEVRRTSSARQRTNIRAPVFKLLKIFSEFGGIRTVVSCVLVLRYDHYATFCWTFCTWRLCYLSGIFFGKLGAQWVISKTREGLLWGTDIFKLDDIATSYVPGPNGCTSKIRFSKLFFL